MIKLKNILNEIGEGVTPFPWKHTGPTKVELSLQRSVLLLN